MGESVRVVWGCAHPQASSRQTEKAAILCILEIISEHRSHLRLCRQEALLEKVWIQLELRVSGFFAANVTPWIIRSWSGRLRKATASRGRISRINCRVCSE